MVIFREIRGENHIQTCGCFEAIGTVLADQGRYDDAFIGYGKALAIRIKLFGEHHLTTADSYGNIGLNMKRKADLDTNFEMCRWAPLFFLVFFARIDLSVPITMVLIFL